MEIQEASYQVYGGKNKRIIRLLAVFTGVKVSMNNDKSDLAGLKGAFYLGFAGYNNLKIDSVIKRLDRAENVTHIFPADNTNSRKLNSLLNVTFDMMNDISKTQRKYRAMVSNII